MLPRRSWLRIRCYQEDLHIDPASGEYKVLIYHTYGSETFADSRPGVIEDTVIGLGMSLHAFWRKIMAFRFIMTVLSMMWWGWSRGSKPGV